MENFYRRIRKMAEDILAFRQIGSYELRDRIIYYATKEFEDCLDVTATEQKKIYIDKACAWIMDELRNPKADTFQEFVDYFRKAMEE